MQLEEEQRLIYAIALRLCNARQLAYLFNTTVEELKVYVADNTERIEAARQRLENPDPPPPPADVTPGQLDDLWISNKFERLKRLQELAEQMKEYLDARTLSPTEFATAVREYRSYMNSAAQELGQLLNRGAGDGAAGDVLSVEIGGVDLGALQ